MMVCYAIGVLTCFALRYYLIWENRRRDRASPVSTTAVEGELGDLNLSDKTDKEIAQFRYVY